MKKHYLLAMVTLFCSLPNFVSAQNTWESIGPHGGYIRCMTKDNQGRIISGNAYGGIFRTSDVGQNWEQIFTGYRNEDVRSLAVNSSNHIFAGTDGHGLYRSTDDGATWQRLNNLIYTSTVIAILITSSGDIFAGTFNGLFRSTDNGNTFIVSSNGISGTSIGALGFSSGYLYAGSDFNGIFRSSDNGNNWESVNNGIDYSNRLVESFASTDFNESRVANVYAALGDKCYRTFDGGVTWDDLQIPQKSLSDIKVRINGDIVASASSNVTTAGGGVIYSPDQGNTWQIYNVPNIPFSAVEEDNNGNLFGGSQGPGTYLTTNNLDWNIMVNGMQAAAINCTNHTNGIITVSTRHSGSFVSDNGGTSWENVSNSLPYGWNYEFKINPVTNSAFLLHQNGTYKTNFGDWNNWTNTNVFANTAAFNSFGYVYLFSGAFCKRSTDDGATFQSINIGNISNVRQVAVDDEDKMFVATANDNGFGGQGVWKSIDLGLTWSPANDGLPNNITAVEAVDITGFGNRDCEKKIVAGSADGKYYSMNNDYSWNEFAVGFQQTQLVKDIGSVNYTEGVDISIISEQVEYKLSPGISCPFFLESDIDNDEILNDITGLKFSFEKMNSQFSYLIGTIGNSVIKKVYLTDVNDEADNLPVKFELSQNYPNPFNPSTTIQFSIPERSFVKLEIYNSLGEKVTTLVSEELNAGDYKYDWNAEKFSSGIYFYKFSTNNFSQERKMILLK